MTYQELIDRYYPADTLRRAIYLKHCRAVADLALEIARDKGLSLDEDDIEGAAMLHDIGICMTDAASIDCHGTEPYIRHGILGAEIMRREGMPETYARVAERHTGAGITREEVEAQGLPLPTDVSYMPETLLERLICYADKFYSKSGDMRRNPFDKVVASMEKLSQASKERFMTLNGEFGPQ